MPQVFVADNRLADRGVFFGISAFGFCSSQPGFIETQRALSALASAWA
jgi:hypothetical protein